MSAFSDAFADALAAIYDEMSDAARYRAPGAPSDGSQDIDCAVIINRDSEHIEMGEMGRTRANGFWATVRRADLAAPVQNGTLRPSEGDYSGQTLKILGAPDPIENDEWRFTVSVTG